MKHKDKARILGAVGRHARQTRKRDPIGYLFDTKRMGPLTEMIAGIGRRHYASKAGKTSWHNKIPASHIIRGGEAGKDTLKQKLLAVPAMIRAARRKK